jgi:hypothetical protein
MKKLIDSCKEKSIKSQIYSNYYRILNITIVLCLIIGGLTVGILQAVQSTINYPILVIGFLIALLQGCQEFFRLSQSAVFYKYASIKFRKMINLADENLFYSSSAHETLRIIHYIRGEMDDLDYNMFITSNPSKLGKADKV